jgi:hypothetical protein
VSADRYPLDELSANYPCAPTAAGLLICPSGYFAISVSSPACKNFSLSRLVETGIGRMSLAPARGAYRDRHGRWVRDAVDAAARADERRCSVRRSRVVLTPRRWRQVRAEAIRKSDGGKKARSPGRARRKPLKPLRRGCRLMRCTCSDHARVLSIFAREAMGASCAPGIPCALCCRGCLAQQLGRIAPRECGGVAAILRWPFLSWPIPGPAAAPQGEGHRLA